MMAPHPPVTFHPDIGQRKSGPGRAFRDPPATARRTRTLSVGDDNVACSLPVGLKRFRQVSCQAQKRASPPAVPGRACPARSAP